MDERSDAGVPIHTLTPVESEHDARVNRLAHLAKGGDGDTEGAVDDPTGLLDDLADRARLFVDFDKTLTLESGGTYFTEAREEKNEAMVEWVNERYKEGYTIVIWSARPWSVAGETAALLAEWGVRYHGLRFEKGGADAYIDDKSYRPEEVLGE